MTTESLKTKYLDFCEIPNKNHTLTKHDVAPGLLYFLLYFLPNSFSQDRDFHN